MLQAVWDMPYAGTMAGELLRVSVNQIDLDSAQLSLVRGEARKWNRTKRNTSAYQHVFGFKIIARSSQNQGSNHVSPSFNFNPFRGRKTT